jgi:MYXO-CTERM domain-containing protein
VSPDDSGHVTRADIQAKLDEIRSATERTASEAAPAGRGAAIAGGVLLVAVAYLFGRRRGRKKTTVVEVRRL